MSGFGAGWRPQETTRRERRMRRPARRIIAYHYTGEGEEAEGFTRWAGYWTSSEEADNRVMRMPARRQSPHARDCSRVADETTRIGGCRGSTTRLVRTTAVAASHHPRLHRAGPRPTTH